LPVRLASGRLFERNLENVMLSPHEIATLMVVKNAPGRIESGLGDLNALLDLKLLTVERAVAGYSFARVTPRGDAVLRAISRRF
jgi:hypothetical protein